MAVTVASVPGAPVSMVSAAAHRVLGSDLAVSWHWVLRLLTRCFPELFMSPQTLRWLLPFSQENEALGG